MSKLSRNTRDILLVIGASLIIGGSIGTCAGITVRGVVSLYRDLVP